MIELENYIGKYILFKHDEYAWIGKLVAVKGANLIQVRELIRIKPTIFVQFIKNFFTVVTIQQPYYGITLNLPSKEEFNEYIKIKRKVVFLGHL